MPWWVGYKDLTGSPSLIETDFEYDYPERGSCIACNKLRTYCDLLVQISLRLAPNALALKLGSPYCVLTFVVPVSALRNSEDVALFGVIFQYQYGQLKIFALITVGFFTSAFNGCFMERSQIENSC